jgi:hypothetical protein
MPHLNDADAISVLEMAVAIFSSDDQDAVAVYTDFTVRLYRLLPQRADATPSVRTPAA